MRTLDVLNHLMHVLITLKSCSSSINFDCDNISACYEKVKIANAPLVIYLLKMKQ